MRALVKAERAEGLAMRDEPKPVIGPDDILIKVAKTGICGTDLHIWNWDQWAQKTIPVPMVVGHEFAGTVAEIGSHVRTVKIGDRVSGEGHLIGMKSRMARAGHFHLDPETKGIGVNVPGAFADFVKIPAFNAIHLPPEVDDEVASILDPLGNAVHTALSYDLVGEDVLITGAGPIGIMAAAVCRHVGARHIVITDINDYRLDLSRAVTDAVTVNVSREDLRDVMHRLHMQEGFDIGLEMSGAPKAFDQMVDHMINGGKIAMLGIPSGPTTVDWNRVIFKSLTIKGIYGREMFETWYKMIAMLQSGLDIRKVITHRMKAEGFAQGFALMKQGSCGKVVLDWNA
ncbi:MAG: L-threonine 3-dehydrogenase [Rhizobiales bacterium]|nr:L-threonine 3-dehydrogenase [Hyphomicrobiales bacterium]